MKTDESKSYVLKMYIVGIVLTAVMAVFYLFSTTDFDRRDKTEITAPKAQALVVPVVVPQAEEPAVQAETEAMVPAEEPATTDSGVIQFRMSPTITDKQLPPVEMTNLLAQGRARMKARLGGNGQ